MKLVKQKSIIDKDDPFKNDVLERKSYGKSLANLIKNVESSDEGLVIALNNDWGEGKTTFVKMWSGLLSQPGGIPNIYLDAFSRDYVDDAFLFIASGINDYVSKNISEKKHPKTTEKLTKKYEELKEKAKKLALYSSHCQ